MALQVKVGHFISPTTTDSSYGVTGVGFTPKAMLFLPTHLTSFTTTSTLDGTFGLGAMTATEQVYAGYGSDDAAATSNVDFANTDARCIVVNDGTNTSVEEASFVSMDSDGFTLNYSKAASAQKIVSYMAFGGGGVDVFAGTFDINTGTGTIDVTGLGFQPKIVIVWVSGFTQTNTVATDGDSHFSCGFSTGTVQSAYIASFLEDGQARTDAGRNNSSGGTPMFVEQTSDTGTNGVLSFSAFLSDGFRVNRSITFANATRACYLAIGGAGMDAFASTNVLNTASTTTTLNTETDFFGDAAILLHIDSISTTVRDLILSAGFTDGTNHRSLSIMEDDNNANGSPSSNCSNTSAYLGEFTVTTAAAGNSGNVTAFNNADITLTTASTPSVADKIGYLVFKSIPDKSFVDRTRSRRTRPLLAM